MNPYLARVADLAPLIAGWADESERARQLTQPLMDALLDAGMFRLLLPRALGGAEIDPVTFVEVMEAVAKIDASTAWCLCQASGCSMTAAYLPSEIASEIFGEPRAILAWGPGSTKAIAVDGGYHVTCSSSFASGMRHATWLGAHCGVYEPDGTQRTRRDGRQEVRTMLFPTSSATINDIWHVIGLRATGSDGFTVTDLFVPSAYSVSRDNPSERRQAGPLYCFSSGNLYASGFAGVALGIARSALDDFIELAKEKQPRGATRPLRESAVVQSQVGLAQGRLGAARRFLLGSLADIWNVVGRAPSLTLDQRVLIRLASTYAIHQAKAVVETLYQAAGASAVFENAPFERRFRDIHAVTQQLQGRESHFETVGQFALGLDPDTAWM